MTMDGERAVPPALSSQPVQATSVVERLRQRARHEPERTAFGFFTDKVADAQLLSYRELDRRARAIAAALRAAGAEGERALLLHPPGLDYVAAVYACFYAGVVAVPAYPPRRGRGMDRVRGIAADCGARFALTTSAAFARSRGPADDDPALARLQWLCTDQLIAGDAGADPPFDAPAIDRLALLQYTSGSTSEPKGVELTHAQFAHNLAQIAECTAVSRDDTIVLWLPPYHDMGLVTGVLLPVWSGTPVYSLSPTGFLQRPARWLEAMSDLRASCSASPNFGYELCVRRMRPEQRAALDLGAWRIALSGAERVSVETLERFADGFAASGFDRAAFAPGYGLAEATLAVTFSTRARPASVRELDGAALGRGRAVPATGVAGTRRLIGSGTPVASAALSIVDPETRAPLPERRIGEIWVRSPSVARGYYGQPELSEAVFHAQHEGAPVPGGHLRTGDLGFMFDGELFVVGRLKDLVIIGGVNHYPDDIEAAVAAAHPDARGTAAAFSIDLATEERLVIVLEVDPERHAPAVELARAVRASVADALELSVHELVLVRPGTVPKTSSGKVRRGRCRTSYLDGTLDAIERVLEPGADSQGEVPAELLARVQALFAELLEVELGSDEDFFAAGGHSLVATQLLSRVREQFGVELDVRVVFEARTARALAARIAGSPRVPPLPELPKVARDEPLPLSFSQERMWFLHQLDPQGAAYNVAGAVEILGSLDAGVLARAFDAAIARHELLRSNYVHDAGTPRVVIAGSRALDLQREDLSAGPDPLDAALVRAGMLARVPFDVARDLLMRAALYRLAPDRHVLVVVMHHLVTDAWSLGVLARDLFALYGAFSRGQPAPLLDQPRSYVDYAAWRRSSAAQEHHLRELEYWRAQLAGAQPLELPTDRRRPARYGSAGSLEPLSLPDELIEALRALGARQGASLFMVLLAAFELLLHRFSGQTDIVVGVPIANRNRLAAESFIGTLVNTLALRLQLNPEATFGALLADVREAALSAYAHQDLPFERLVAELGLARDAGRSPLVQVMFDFQNAPLRRLRDGALSLRPLQFSRGAAQFDLSLLILDSEIGKTAGIEYRTDLFDAGTIRRMLGHYAAILRAVVEDPSRPLASIVLLGPEEREATIAAGRGARPDRPFESVTRMFAQHVERTPDAPAISDAGGMLSYRALAERSRALARDLRGLGARPGERVVILLERSNAIAVALLAVLETGASYVPLDPLYPPARLALVLEDCTPCAAVTSSALLPSLGAELAGRALAVDLSGGPRSANAEQPPAAATELPDDPARIAYVLYTSGSTGRPKGVEVSHLALGNFVRSIAHTPGMSREDRLLSVTTIAFDIAGLELFVPLTTGASLHVAGSDVVADGRALLRCMQQQRPSVMQATPATWKMLIEAGWPGSSELAILCGGEALPPELAAALLARGKSLWNMYGPTETTIWSAVQRVTSAEPPIAVGRPIDHTRFYVLDPQRQLVPLGVPGEIAIGGRGVARGYFGLHHRTEQRFVPDPFSDEPGARMYLTGDRGRLAPDGTLFCEGRLDDQIKIRGYRVEPAEIEAVLKSELGVRDAVVIVREDRPGDRRLVAYCATAEGALPPASALRETLRRRLPEYMVPAHFVALPRLPLTPNGKIDRRALPAPEPGQALAAAYEAPRDELETKMARLWQDVLELPRVGRADNFFDLGGHSLLAVRLFALIERELQVTLPLTSVLETRTLAELTDRVRQALADHEQQRRGRAIVRGGRHLVVLRPGEGRLPVFCVHGAGGNVLNLHPLAHGLGEGRAVYGFVAPGSDGVGPLGRSIEQLAERYLAEARAVLPEGPFHLVGYCGGGLIAYEMARMLHASQTPVGLLGLIDSYHPRIDTLPARITLMLDGVRREGPLYTVTRAIRRLRRELTALLQELSVELSLAVRGIVPFALRDYWLTKGFFRLAAQYDPRPYAGQLTIFHAAEQDPLLLDVGPELGWTELIQGGIEVEDVPGNHDTLALPPNVETLAAKLSAALDAADERIRRVPAR